MKIERRTMGGNYDDDDDDDEYRSQMANCKVICDILFETKF